MVREIYEVYAKIVDANGAYNTLTGYPKTFDSRNYNTDPAYTELRARGQLGEAFSQMVKVTTRKLQIGFVVRAKTGEIIDKVIIGTIPDDPGNVVPE